MGRRKIFMLNINLKFAGIVDKLISTKRIEGIVSGGGSSRSAYYIPSAYTKAQVQW